MFRYQAQFARRTCAVIVGIILSGRALLRAQEVGSVGGLVVSSWDGSPLPGVTVTVRGTTLAAQSSPAGRYQLNSIPVGTQVLRFSKPGFASAVVTDVRILPGQTNNVDGNLRPEFYEMEEFEVTAEEFSEQTEQILFERQQSGAMLEGIGSDMFKNLAVSDAAGALTKVTGATVADGKYAVIRGLADRYTFTTLNGLELPSADPDRKAFQLDLMPSKFIDRMDVYKTFTPDMSGGFAGGSIDIATKSYPEEFVFELRASTAYNTQSSLRDDFPSSNRGNTDWLAMDDGTREMPKEVQAQNPSGGAAYPPEAKSSFKSSQFTPSKSESPLDTGLDLLFGNTHKLFDKRIGYLAGINFKNEYRMYDNEVIRSYDERGTTLSRDKTGVRGMFDAQWGALANLSLEMSEGHELSFNFLRVQAAQDTAQRVVGQEAEGTVPGESYADQSILNWVERSLSYYQLGGTHTFAQLNDVKFDWGAAYSVTTQEEPDYRIFQFQAEPGSETYNPNITFAQPNFPTRFWRELEETGRTFRGDFTIPVPSYNEQDNFVKTGAALNLSERDYFQRGIDLRPLPGTTHPFNSIGDPDIWMSPENLPFIFMRNFPANLTYSGEQTVTAGYLMADWAALNWLRFIGGARFEATDIAINTFDVTRNIPLTPGEIKQNDWLPSLAAKFQIRTNVDLIASWSRTVVRPTYREIAEVPIYDVAQSRTYLGNPALRMSASENFDLRASWYPRPGELVSAGVFAKRIDAPIELAGKNNDNSQITYENFEEAKVFGVEGEVRFQMNRVWDPLEDLFFGLNGAWITSEVPLTAIQRDNRVAFSSETERPLYDQPEYILNGSLTWEIERSRTTVTVSGGVVGESLILVGLAKPDEYVQPAPDLNLFVRQRLGKNWDVRFTAKNLLDPEFEVAQTWPEVGKVVLESYTKGITFGLSVGCEF
ncbi:MAG TPA: TonB-dependent receptor [Verrucomicrobiae bacterium]